MANKTIFISYSRVDYEFVLNLAKKLRMAGANIWLDQLDIEPGAPWDKSIESALASSSTLLVIISKSSVDSINVLNEVSFALTEKKAVVSVLLEECDIPFRLRRLPIADFSTDQSKGIENLATALNLKDNVVSKLLSARVKEPGVGITKVKIANDSKGSKPGGSSSPKPGGSSSPKPGGSSSPKPGVSSSPKPGGSSGPKPGGSIGPILDDLEIPLEFNEQKRIKESKVSINVYSSPKFDRGEQQLIQIWMFTSKHQKKVKKSALSYDEESLMLGFENLLIPIENGTEVMLRLSSQDIHFSEQKSFQWLGKISNKNFMVEIPSIFKKDKVFFTLEVYINQLIIGEITFMLKARDKFSDNSNFLLGKNEGTPQPIGDKAKRFKKAFISYTSKDRLEVLKVVRGIAASNTYEIFQDIMSLDAGERWEKRLYKEIDSCDVFFLFWSEASSNSKWVQEELNYALEQKRDEIKYPLKIQPVIIPPMINPPEQLNHLHFNDKIIPFIIAEEQIRESQEKK